MKKLVKDSEAKSQKGIKTNADAITKIQKKLEK